MASPARKTVIPRTAFLSYSSKLSLPPLTTIRTPAQQCSARITARLPQIRTTRKFHCCSAGSSGHSDIPFHLVARSPVRKSREILKEKGPPCSAKVQRASRGGVGSHPDEENCGAGEKGPRLLSLARIRPTDVSAVTTRSRTAQSEARAADAPVSQTGGSRPP